MSGYLTSTNLLDEYNKKIAGASTSGAFTIGGVTYNSEKEFWQFKRDSYIADDSANGLFARLSDEQKTNLKVRSSQNLLSNEDITKSTAAFTALSSRPELQTYIQKIDTYKQDVLQTGIDLRSAVAFQEPRLLPALRQDVRVPADLHRADERRRLHSLPAPGQAAPGAVGPATNPEAERGRP